MTIVAGLMVAFWVWYTYERYAKTQRLFYPVTGFIVTYFYGVLMTAGSTADYVLAVL